MAPKSLFTWYGGKGAISQWIVTHFRVPHKTYVEPFGGGGALLLEHLRAFGPCQNMVYNDLHPGATAFVRALQSPEKLDRLEDHLHLIPHSFFEHHACFFRFSKLMKSGGKMDDVSISILADFLASQRQGFSGVGRTWGRDIGDPARNERWRASIRIGRSLSRIVRRCHLTVCNEDFESVVTRFDSPETLHYLDPPYMADTRADKSVYAFELEDKDQHRMCDAILRLKGMVVLSGYDHPLYNKRFREWKKAVLDVACIVNTTRYKKNRDTTRRQEFLWLSPNLARKLARNKGDRT